MVTALRLSDPRHPGPVGVDASGCRRTGAAASRRSTFSLNDEPTATACSSAGLDAHRREVDAALDSAGADRAASSACRSAACRGARSRRGIPIASRRWCWSRRRRRAGSRPQTAGYVRAPAPVAAAVRLRGARSGRAGTGRRAADVARPRAFARGIACRCCARRARRREWRPGCARWRDLDIATTVARISAPTLVLTGERGLDRVVPVSSSLEYIKLIRRRTASRVAGAPGISALITQPERASPTTWGQISCDERDGQKSGHKCCDDLQSDGPAGPLEALLDEPATDADACGGGVRTSASAAGRHDAHQGGVSGRERPGRASAARCCGSTSAASARAAANSTPGRAKPPISRRRSISMAARYPARRSGRPDFHLDPGSRSKPAPRIRACRRSSASPRR